MGLNWSTTSASAGAIKALVYGSAGAGKTTFCGTAPSPLIISAEAGLLSIRSKNLPVLEVKTAQDVWDALAWCQTDAAKNGIQTVCLDSISEITETILANEKKKTKDPRQAYGEMNVQTIEMVKGFRDLPNLHTIVTCKAINSTDPISGVAKSVPWAPGQQVGPQLPYLFDLVMYMGTDKDPQGNTFHYARTRAGFNADAKDRSGVLDEIEFPDFTHLLSKISA